MIQKNLFVKRKGTYHQISCCCCCCYYILFVVLVWDCTITTGSTSFLLAHSTNSNAGKFKNNIKNYNNIRHASAIAGNSVVDGDSDTNDTNDDDDDDQLTKKWNSAIQDIIMQNKNNNDSNQSSSRLLEFANALWNIAYRNPGIPSHQQYVLLSKKQKCDAPFPNLYPVQPIHNNNDFSWTQDLENKWKIIHEELQQFLHASTSATTNANGENNNRSNDSNDSDDNNNNNNNEWKTSTTKLCHNTNGFTKLILQDENNHPSLIGQKYFSKTLSLLHSIVGFKNLAPRPITINCQLPNTGLALHSDNMNFILSCHLGLQIPKTNNDEVSSCYCCIFYIGDEIYYWENGKIVIADTSFLHSTENNSNVTNQSRYILSFSIWHPNLSQQERQGIQTLHDILKSLLEQQQ